MGVPRPCGGFYLGHYWKSLSEGPLNIYLYICQYKQKECNLAVLLVNSHVLGQGRIPKLSYWGWGGEVQAWLTFKSPFAYFLQSVQIPFQGNLNFQGGRGIHVFRRCGGQGRGGGVEVLILILKETYNTCNFRGGGGPALPIPTSLWIRNSWNHDNQ